MKLLGEGIKKLPSHLLDLSITLTENNLGEKGENMKFLGEGLK